ncbi:hypothetical protein [Candidatus Chloroploca sp. Khr17]|uniref:hypothetical protein n=1 Tax=Candidatus Chloroploca sp. Khr17 TaxID=2496869 RepID=UPI00101C4A37|nr:hypothetical protein [Candidatus Chloroploca sp. Khr17]
MKILSNTTVLSNFARIQQLTLLHRLFGTLYLPTEVFAEIQAAQIEGYSFFEGIEQQVVPFVADGWLHLVTMTEQELRQFGAMQAGLHRGERACLAIATQRSWLLLTDDRAARAQAQRQKIAISGTIGCLTLSVERKIATLDQANGWLAAMIAQGYHAPLTDLSALIQPER